MARVTQHSTQVAYDPRKRSKGFTIMGSWTSGGLAIGQFNFIHAAILLIGCSVLQAAYAQSFDCSKALTSIEHAICEDKRLGDEDEALARELKAAVAAMPERRQLLLEDQRRWLGYRDYRCRGESSLRRSWCWLRWFARCGRSWSTRSASGFGAALISSLTVSRESKVRIGSTGPKISS